MPKKNPPPKKKRFTSTAKQKTKSKSKSTMEKTKRKTPVSRSGPKSGPGRKGMGKGQMSIERSLMNQTRQKSGFVSPGRRSTGPSVSTSSESGERASQPRKKQLSGSGRGSSHFVPATKKRKSDASVDRNPYKTIKVAGATVDRWKPLSDDTLSFVQELFEYHTSMVLTKADSEMYATFAEVLENFKLRLLRELKKMNAPQVDALTCNYRNSAKAKKHLKEILRENNARLQRLEEEIIDQEKICDKLEEDAALSDHSSGN